MAGVRLAKVGDDNGVDRPKNSAIVVREKEVGVSAIEFEIKCM